jgi:hypothetical protein
MNYKPDEATWMAYLYGELGDAEKRQVEAYLQQHPEEQKRLEEWSFARAALDGLSDKEVIAPPIVLGDTPAISWWKERTMRMSLGIAASVVMVLIAARLLGLSITASDGELRIAFGQAKPVPALTRDEVRDMIKGNNQELQASWSEERKAVEASLQDNLKNNSGKIDKLMKTASLASQDQVKLFVSQMQENNLKLMKDYLRLSSAGQKEYVETLLVDFSKYLQEQRRQDIQMIQARVNQVEEHTDKFKLETEEILTSLITNNNPNGAKHN